MFCVKVFIRPLLLEVMRGIELCVRELKKKTSQKSAQTWIYSLQNEHSPLGS